MRSLNGPARDNQRVGQNGFSVPSRRFINRVTTCVTSMKKRLATLLTRKQESHRGGQLTAGEGQTVDVVDDVQGLLLVRSGIIKLSAISQDDNGNDVIANLAVLLPEGRYPARADALVEELAATSGYGATTAAAALVFLTHFLLKAAIERPSVASGVALFHLFIALRLHQPTMWTLAKSFTRFAGSEQAAEAVAQRLDELRTLYEAEVRLGEAITAPDAYGVSSNTSVTSGN